MFRLHLNQLQVKLCKEADIVTVVSPKIAEAYKLKAVLLSEYRRLQKFECSGLRERGIFEKLLLICGFKGDNIIIRTSG